MGVEVLWCAAVACPFRFSCTRRLPLVFSFRENRLAVMLLSGARLKRGDDVR